LRDAEKDKHALEGELAYKTAFEMARNELKSHHSVRLGTILNYSLFLYEIKENVEEAVAIARKGFDEAVGELDDLTEDAYKDATVILQLIKDNLQLWAPEKSQ